MNISVDEWFSDIDRAVILNRGSYKAVSTDFKPSEIFNALKQDFNVDCLQKNVQIESSFTNFFFHLWKSLVLNPTVLKIMSAVAGIFGADLSKIMKVTFEYKDVADLQESISQAQRSTTVYTINNVPSHIARGELKTKIIFTDWIDSLSVADHIKTDDPANDICFFNFANSIHPGGAFLFGSKGSQEEDIMRRTYLYPCLDPDLNPFLEGALSKLGENPVPIHIPYLGVVYHSGIPEIEDPENKVNVISIAAIDMRESSTELKSLRKLLLAERNPDIGNFDCFLESLGLKDLTYKGEAELIKQITLAKIRTAFWAAKAAGHKHVVAGKFGCGAFLNNPKMIAECYKTVIDEFYGHFESVIFPVNFEKDGDFATSIV